MKKIIFTLSILFFPVVLNASHLESLTTYTNGICIEDAHVWANDCSRAFDWITTATNYWQSSTLSGHYVWFSFYSSRKIAKYWIINSNNDAPFNMTAFRFQALVEWVWTTLDTKSPYTVVPGKWVYTELLNPVYSTQYRVIVDTPWSSWTLISEIAMFDSDAVATQDQYFTEEGIKEIAIVEMVWLLIFWVIAFGLNLKNII